MKWSENAFVLAVSTLLFSTSVYGVTNDSMRDERNYRLIVERNPFGLKPPPAPQTNAPPPPAARDEILLTGISSIGTLRAYFMSKAPQGKTPDYYSLGIDEKRDALEVLDINPSAMSVRVRNSGVESVMTFASNGVKAPAAPAAPPAGAPGAVQMPGNVATPGGVVRPGMIGTPPPLPTPNAPGMPSGFTPGVTTPGRIRTIPSRNVRTRTVVNPQMPVMDANQPPPTPDPNAAVQDVLMMELQKRANPDMPFPPTPLPQ